MAPETPPDERARVARAYHARTKHHPQRYARALGYMDWDSQPDPFRTYEGAPRVRLPLLGDELEAGFGRLHAPRAVEPSRLNARSIGAFFQLALGITAWKEYEGVRWALRADPSSGNLHPTEGYAVLPEVDDIRAGVHHYVSRDHALEARCVLADEDKELARALAGRGFLVGISSIHWREAWKYGERAWRYCQHDAGHVLGSLRYAAACLGWTAHLLDGIGTASVASLLGLDRPEQEHVDPLEREHADAVLCVGPPEGFGLTQDAGVDLVGRVRAALTAGEWSGRPNVLSTDRVHWEVIDAVAEVTEHPGRIGAAPPFAPAPLPARDDACAAPAAKIIRQRRSAVELDGKTGIPRATFLRMLDALLPRPGVPPFDVLPWEPRVHLALFVHRVEDVEPGVYILERNGTIHPTLTAMLGSEAAWARPDGCPAHLRLFRIASTDCRRAAARVSCGQDIAGDGAFSLGMLAEFDDTLDAGPHRYPQLFWETGVIGQSLYLEAEAAGVRGTGIGCFFDDLVHQVVGLEGEALQSLYHFTIGGPVEDTRLTTLPAYG